jgi:hypothetical protein
MKNALVVITFFLSATAFAEVSSFTFDCKVVSIQDTEVVCEAGGHKVNVERADIQQRLFKSGDTVQVTIHTSQNTAPAPTSK